MNRTVSIESERLRELIEKKQLKKGWLAYRVGVHKTTLRRWLSGRIRKMRSAHLLQLADSLEVLPQELLGKSG